MTPTALVAPQVRHTVIAIPGRFATWYELIAPGARRHFRGRVTPCRSEGFYMATDNHTPCVRASCRMGIVV